MRVLRLRIVLVALCSGLSACAPGAAGQGITLASTAQLAASASLRTPLGNFDPKTQTLPELSLLAAPSTSSSAQQLSTWLVQFDTNITQDMRLRVADTGARIAGFWPDRALLVRATPAQLAQVAKLAHVRATVMQPHLWRLDTRLVTAEAQGFGLSHLATTQQVLVAVHEAGAMGAVISRAQALGGQVVGAAPLQDALVAHLQVPQSALDALASDDAVAFVEPFAELEVHNDTSYGVIQAGSAHHSPLWDHGLHGEGQILASCDVGVATNSCFFPSGKIIGYAHLTSLTTHNLAHGTHVAGSLVGDQNGNGIYDLDDGMAPGAKLYVQDAGGARTGVLDLPADLTNIFATAYAQGARIHSDSWGTQSGAGALATYGVREQTLDSFVAAHRDFLAVLAAGNNPAAGGPTSIDSPAAAKNVITVGAMQGLSMDDAASFSSDGPCADGRIKPTLMAPGVNVVSASVDDCGTTVLSGTSQAAPTLAGGAALVRQYLMDGYYPSGAADPARAMAPSAAVIKAMLIAGAEPMLGDNTGGALLAAGEGFGRVHLAHAAPMAGDATSLWLDDEPLGLAQDDSMTVELNVATAGDVHVALTWMDAPASLGAGKALVNDLDLTVTGPGGTYLGNVMKNSISTPAAGAQDGDHTNVEEVVRLTHAPAGRYLIHVQAISVPQGPQPFAVVALVPSYTLLEAPTQTSSTQSGAAAPTQTPTDTVDAGGAGARVHNEGCASSGASCQLLVPSLVLVLARLRRRRGAPTAV